MTGTMTTGKMGMLIPESLRRLESVPSHIISSYLLVVTKRLRKMNAPFRAVKVKFSRLGTLYNAVITLDQNVAQRTLKIRAETDLDDIGTSISTVTIETIVQENDEVVIGLGQDQIKIEFHNSATAIHFVNTTRSVVTEFAQEMQIAREGDVLVENDGGEQEHNPNHFVLEPEPL